MPNFVEKHKTFRAFLHIPVGLMSVWAFQTSLGIGAAFFLAFMIYELEEDMKLKDGAYIDIAGYLWGLALGVIGLNVWRFMFG